MIKVKICGITNLEDALFCSNQGADALGFIFTKKSPRYIKPAAAKKIVSQLDPFLTKVGVFLDEGIDKVVEIAESVGLDVLQFHGNETVKYCAYFKEKFGVIKVLFPPDCPYIKKARSYKVDAFLFDIKYEEKVKGRKKLPEDILNAIASLIARKYRVIISGGLTPENVSDLKKIAPYAVDVAGGVEELVGKKSYNLVREFIKSIK